MHYNQAMKDEYFKTLATRAKQRTKLLIAKPDFQKDIALLRKKWSIPDNGLSDEESNRKWNLQLATNTAAYYSKNWLRGKKQIIKLRKNGGIFKCDNCGKTLTLQEGFEEIKTTIEEIQKADKFGIKKRH